MKKRFRDFFILLISNLIISNVSKAQNLEELIDPSVDKKMIVETKYGDILIDLLEKEAPINTAGLVKEFYKRGWRINGKISKSGDGSIDVLMNEVSEGDYSRENILGIMYPYDKNVLFMPWCENCTDYPILILGVEREYTMYNPKIGEILDGYDIVYKLKDGEHVKIKIVGTAKKGSARSILTKTFDDVKKTFKNIFKIDKEFDLPLVIDKTIETKIKSGLEVYGRGFLVMPLSSIKTEDGKVYAINIKSEFSKLKGNKIITPMYLRQVSPTTEYKCYYYTLTIGVNGNFISLERDSVGKW